MINVIVSLIIILAVILAAGYMIKVKKKGHACIGCPHSSQCSGHCHSSKQ